MVESICAECRRDRRIAARGCCSACYLALKRTGQLDRHPRVRRTWRVAIPLEEWLATVVNTEGCWPWPYSLDGDGYGRFTRNGETRRVHRMVWERLIGPCPEGLVPDHQCHNAAAAAGLCAGDNDCQHRRCANPADILWVPPGVNAVSSGLSASGRNAAKIVCDAGHPLSGDNLYIRPDGTGRGCRRCRLDQRNRRARPSPAPDTVAVQRPTT